MILSYGWRFVAVVFASFFLIHLVMSFVVAICIPGSIRMGSRIGPRRAARLFLTLRLLPTCAALFAVIAFCVPSYFWWEAEPASERVGFVFVCAAVFGAAIWTFAFVRLASALMRFSRLLRNSQPRESLQLGRSLRVIEGPDAFIALAGIRRPRIVLSAAVVRTLSDEELSAVIGHEEAHRKSGDNIKRLCLFLAPAIFPSRDGSRALEQWWIRFSEYAADDDAVGPDVRRSLALASALVRVARLGSFSAAGLTASPLLDESDLPLRVQRLLAPGTMRKTEIESRPQRFLPLVFCVCLVSLAPFSYPLVQAVLEKFIR